MDSSRCVQLFTLLTLTILSITLLGTDQPGMCLQSPVSPLIPNVVPHVFSTTPSVTPDEQTPHLLSESFWSSPLPWIAVGIIVFGGLAWVLILLLRRVESQDT